MIGKNWIETLYKTVMYYNAMYITIIVASFSTVYQYLIFILFSGTLATTN